MLLQGTPLVRHAALFSALKCAGKGYESQLLQGKSLMDYQPL